ncbi:uncharacterized protein B0T23DRAFT_421600, partial [Neurospora hispaniola]
SPADSKGPDLDNFSVCSSFHPSGEEDWLSDHSFFDSPIPAVKKEQKARVARRGSGSDSDTSTLSERERRQQWRRANDERVREYAANRLAQEERQRQARVALEAHWRRQEEARKAPRGPRVIRDPISGRVYTN